MKRDDVTVIGVPLARLCNENFQGVRTRILMKNICYVGVLAALCNLDLDIIRTAAGRDLRQEGAAGGCQHEGEIRIEVDWRARIPRTTGREHLLERFFPAGLDRMVNSAVELSKITSEDPFRGFPASH